MRSFCVTTKAGTHDPYTSSPCVRVVCPLYRPLEKLLLFQFLQDCLHSSAVCMCFIVCAYVSVCVHDCVFVFYFLWATCLIINSLD